MMSLQFMPNLQTMFTTPVSLAAVKTANEVTQMVTSGSFVFDAVCSVFMPLVWDIGKVLFAVGCMQGIYLLMRSDTKGFVNKTKWATTGYILLRFIQVFITFVDTLAIGMAQSMGIGK